MMARPALVVAAVDPRAVDQQLLRPSVPELPPTTAPTSRMRFSGPLTTPTAPAVPSTNGCSRFGAQFWRRGRGRNT